MTAPDPKSARRPRITDRDWRHISGAVLIAIEAVEGKRAENNTDAMLLDALALKAEQLREVAVKVAAQIAGGAS